jgi:Cu-processing system permease protein
MNASNCTYRTQVCVIAGKEFHDRLRSRWVTAVSLVFAAFTVVTSYFGAAVQGVVGFQGIEPLIASLVSLTIYLLPLIALILGFDALVGERERGTLNLMLSYPISRIQLVLGKYLGLAAALTCATLAGFGLAGIVIALRAPTADWYQYAGFVVSAVLLGWVFLSLAVSASAFCRSRTSASGVAVALWFFFVLVYDLLLLGALVLTGGSVVGPMFPVLLMLNPADVFRILNIFGPGDLHTMYGLVSVFPAALAQPMVLGLAMLAWIVAPLGLAAWRFDR